MNTRRNIRSLLPRKRYVFGFAILLFAGILCVLIVDTVVNVERYRPVIVSALKEATGMDASIGRIRLRVVPIPSVVIYDLAVGNEDGRVIAGRIVVPLRLRSITERRILIGDVALSKVRVMLPRGLDSLKNMASHFRSPGASSGPTVEVGGIFLRDGEIRLDEDGPALATLEGSALTPMADNMPVRLKAALPALGASARCSLEASVSLKGCISGSATASLENVEPAALSERQELAGTLASLNISVKFSSPRDVCADISGVLTGASQSVLNGTLSAAAKWNGNGVVLNGVKWNSTGVSIEAEATWTPPRTFSGCVVKAGADATALQALAQLQTSTQIHAAPRPGASLAVENLKADIVETGETRVSQGTLALRGIDVTSGGGQSLLANLILVVRADEGAVRVEELSADGLKLSGSLRPDWQSRSIALEASGSFSLMPAWLAFTPPSFPIKDISGECVVDRVSATVFPGRGLPEDLDVSGSLNRVNVTMALPGRQKPLEITELHGSAGFKGGVITLDSLAANGLVISGTMRPMKESIALDLRGKASIQQVPLSDFVSRNLLSDWGGTLVVEKLQGTFDDKEIPADLCLVASMEQGKVTLTIPGYADMFSNVSAHLKADARGMKADWSMKSAKTGTFTLEGGYEAETRALRGSLTADISQCALPFLRSAKDRQLWFPIISRLGPSTFRLDTTLPPKPVARLRSASDSGDLRIAIARDGEPACGAAFILRQREGKWDLRELEASLSVPFDLLKALIPQAIEAQGNAVLRAVRVMDAPRWEVAADFAETGAIVGEYLYKKPGDPLSARADCAMESGNFKLSNVRVQYGNLEIPLRIAEEGVYVDNAEIDLSKIAGLLPEDGSAHGHVRGSFSSKPLRADLELDDVSAFVGPKMGFESVSGKVRMEDNILFLENLHARGLDSNVTFNVKLVDGVFQGEANGVRLNVNELIYFIDHLKDYRVNPKPENKDEPWRPSPFECDLKTALDTVVYRKGTARDVTGVFSMHEEVIRAYDLVGTPYSGRLTGSLVIEPGRNIGASRVLLDFDTQDIDARYVDELVFDTTRGLKGAITGKVKMSIGTPDDQDPIEYTNGGFQIHGKNGSLGEIVFAKSLHRMLKTAALIRFRAPEYRQNSLDFDELDATVEMKDGVWKLSGIDMKNPYVSMTGDGTVDFRKKETDVRLRVNYMESVTGIMERVPIVGSAISKVGGMAGLNLLLYDSPYDVKVRLNPAQRFEMSEERKERAKEKPAKSPRGSAQ